jgi:hypothetical protein
MTRNTVLIFAAAAFAACTFSSELLAQSAEPHAVTVRQSAQYARWLPRLYGSNYGWAEIQALRAFERMR